MSIRICLFLVVFSLLVFSVSASASSVELSASALDASGISRGFCSVWAPGDAALPVALAQDKHCAMVHALYASQEEREAAIDAADAAGIAPGKLIIEQCTQSTAPYADNMVDWLLVAGVTADALQAAPWSEAARVLRPNGQLIILEPALNVRALKELLTDAGLIDIKEDKGGWMSAVKPRPQGVDNWTHWEHGPDNNPVSTDEVIRAPYMSQWMGEPYYVPMPAITTSANGRLFFAMGHIAHHKREEKWLNTLLARNAYNGVELWRKNLPDGYLVHRSAFIALNDAFIMIDYDGSGCLILDPETGEEIGRVHLPDHSGQWRWIALSDGILYALIGEEQEPAEATMVRSKRGHWSWGELSPGYYTERIPWGYGKTLIAYDLKKQKVQWQHQEDKDIDSRAMAVGDGNVFFYAPGAHLGCLNGNDGDVVWTQDDQEIQDLIELKGIPLESTPGWRTTTYCLYSPDALIYEAQARANVVAISPEDGRMLWHRAKTTNNPNPMYLDGKVLVGIGEGGNTLIVEPATGETIEDLGFKKRSCVRLTATPDSLFVRGWPEGLTRYDRESKVIQFNGAFRPGCNDGAIGANGLLYAGPWACDCNLSLQGRIALTSAQEFPVSQEGRFQSGDGVVDAVKPLAIVDADWNDYRGGNAHAGGTPVALTPRMTAGWTFNPKLDFEPTTPTAVGDRIFFGGDDGIVRALDSTSGAVIWTYRTSGPIMQPPSIWNGRAYVGSGDGFVYALEAETGRLLWRFRAAPVDRRIMLYGKLASTWPVNTGVLVNDGVAYFAAGVVDYDGTYVYALDAVTGKMLWQNDSSGHIREDLRKGVSAQGNLIVRNGQLMMSAGNILAVAPYDLKTGEYQGPAPTDGSPIGNRGEELCNFLDVAQLHGGRPRYSARENVVTTANFYVSGQGGAYITVTQGRVPPAWDNEILVAAASEQPPVAYPSQSIAENHTSGRGIMPLPLWTADALNNTDTTGLLVAADVVIGTAGPVNPTSPRDGGFLFALDKEDGTMIWKITLPTQPLPGGLAVTRDGKLLVPLMDGRIMTFDAESLIRSYISNEVARAAKGGEKNIEAAKTGLRVHIRMAQTRETIDAALAALDELGVHPGADLMQQGYVRRCYVVGPFAGTPELLQVEKTLMETGVQEDQPIKFAGRTIYSRAHFAQSDDGMIDPTHSIAGNFATAGYIVADLDLPRNEEVTLAITGRLSYGCMFNGKRVGVFPGVPNPLQGSPETKNFKVQAKQGENRLMIRIDRLHGLGAVAVQVLDAQGNPIDLTNRQ